MAKIDRKNMKIFGVNATTNQRGVFGSLAAGFPAYSTDPETIQSLANYESGWFSAVLGNNSPAIQDMNALQFLFAYQIAYLMQSGIAEWNSSTTYYTGSLVTAVGTGVMYVSLVDNNLNNAVSDPTKWLPAVTTSSLRDNAVTLAKLAATVQQSLIPAGTLLPTGRTTAPTGYLLCDGAAISRTTYADLFSAIGTTFGVGDGSTTFNIPNTQGIFVRGAGSQTISGTGYTATLGQYVRDQMQGHWHYVFKTSADENFMGNDAAGGGGFNQGGSTGKSNSPDSERIRATDPIQDLSNTWGTPRYGGETRPAFVATNYMIKY